MAQKEFGELKPLSAATIKKLNGHPETQFKNATWHSMNIQIRMMLSLDDFISTVHTSIENCTDSNGNFTFELIDFALRINIIVAYAYVEMPEDINDLYMIAYASGLYELVCSVANTNQIDAIRDCVYRVSMIRGDQYEQCSQRTCAESATLF